MTKEEQLKIYSAYLPYRLKVQSFNLFKGNPIFELTYGKQRPKEAPLEWVLYESIENFKPILYPLEYLTKEIDHKGEMIIPLKDLLKLALDEKDHGEGYYSKDDIIETEIRNGFSISGIVNEYSKFTIRYYAKEQIFSLFHPLGNDMHLSYKYRDKLLEWHFNVFNIPEGEYINKATLKH